MLTFLPMSLLYQFKKIANCYYVVIILLRFIPGAPTVSQIHIETVCPYWSAECDAAHSDDQRAV